MKQSRDKRLSYEVIRSHRSTADIIIERDGSVLVRAPEWADDDAVANIVEAKHYWIYQGLAEWRDLNASRVLREYKNGEGFPYLGRAYRLSLVGDQREPLQLKNGRFTLRRRTSWSKAILRLPKERFERSTSRREPSGCEVALPITRPRSVSIRQEWKFETSATDGPCAHRPGNSLSIGDA